MHSEKFIHDIWIRIGPLKLQLSWPLLLVAGGGIVLISMLSAYCLLRNRGRA